ncbi:MAG: hypothetical protein IPG04_39200 [Polyangiaceae bacterium]|nr:hypothetical protein [Polyangiaceae bacterium]
MAGELTAQVGPLLLKVSEKGDGRWDWQVWNGPARNPMATGIGSSKGAAKTAAEQLAKRSGLV